jgi:hypothetical protein
MINTYSKRNTLTGFTLNKMVKEIYAVIEMPNEKAGGLRYQTFKGHAYPASNCIFGVRPSQAA